MTRINLSGSGSASAFGCVDSQQKMLRRYNEPISRVGESASDKTKFTAMAKRLATDCGMVIASHALQLQRGYGYQLDYRVERSDRDLRVH